jgi:hypothetical protein
VAALGLRSLLELAREGRVHDPRPIRLGGARELVPLLARELRAGGEAAAVDTDGPVEHAAALVWLGAPELETLRRARRARVPLVGVSDGTSIPYVLDTDLVRVAPGQGMPVADVARVLARVLPRGGAPLAARLPVLRAAVSEQLIARAARQNGLAAAAISEGADLPVLTLGELRLVLALARANGEEASPGARLPELLAVLGAARLSRRLARVLRRAFPGAAPAMRAGVAYGATRAIGEAARRRFASASVRPRT